MLAEYGKLSLKEVLDPPSRMHVTDRGATPHIEARRKK